MALADSITALGTAIINLVGTRLNRDANNFSAAGTQNLNNMIDSRIGAVTGAPVGTVIAYMGTDEPEGFLLMDGRELSRTTYAALFAVIGTSQGAGNGSTTFNIADMTDGRYLMGSTVAGSSEPARICNIVGTLGIVFEGTTDNGPFTFQYRDSYGEGTSGWGKEVARMDLSKSSPVYTNETDSVNPISESCKFLIKY